MKTRPIAITAVLLAIAPLACSRPSTTEPEQVAPPRASVAAPSTMAGSIPQGDLSGMNIDRSRPDRAPSVASAQAKFGAVASVNPMATDAAMATLRDGGNAIDAAVATMLTLGVVDTANSGIGGGCFMVIRLANGEVHALDGREMAGAAAKADMFIRDGKGDTSLSQTGALASGVPGSLAVYDHALKNYGKKKLADVILPAAKIAEVGFRLDANNAGKIRRTAESIAKFEGSKAVMFGKDGQPLKEGDMVVQTDLAKTYRAIANEGVDYFYKGEYAKRVEAWMQANGGILTAADFANYHIVDREPIKTTYRGQTVIGMPPPSSGGLHVAQILAMLERFDVSAMSEADRLTTIANAMNLAFADRAFWLGDPDFVKVPKGLVDPGYLKDLSAKVVSDKAIEVKDHGNPPKADEETFKRLEGKHTTHVSVADAEGNCVAVTATVNTSFGSKVVVPGTGVFLNNQMDDFSIQPGVANAFGLVGAENNAPAAGKRPLSSMSPTIVLDAAGKPRIVVGAAGGPKIITQVVNVLSNLIDKKLDGPEAMKRPRIHHQWQPNELWIERTFDQAVRDELTKRGFKLAEANPSGATNLVIIEGTTLTAVSEPRLSGKAAAE